MTLTQKLLSRCDAGWTLAQKWGLTALLLVYWISPIDFAPDIIPVLGQCDDVFLTYCLFRVWRSSTLTGTATATPR